MQDNATISLKSRKARQNIARSSDKVIYPSAQINKLAPRDCMNFKERRTVMPIFF